MNVKAANWACIRLWAFGLLFVGICVFAQTGSGSGSGGDVVKEPTSKRRSSSRTALIELKDDNWQLMLKGEWMVEFFAPWCPACKNLAPTWERFANVAIDENVNVAKIDVTTSPSLSGRFFVTALPTIYHVKEGDFRQYRGSRDGDALMMFLKQQQWQTIEPISAWKKPDTVHMSILSYFFKLSHTLKDFNARLQEDYGLPTWGSYALFAIGTIFVGAGMGLMLVCVVDFLYPPKKSQRQSFSEARQKSLNSVEDLANDEIEDDDDEEAPLLVGNDEEDEEDEEEDATVKHGAGDAAVADDEEAEAENESDSDQDQDDDENASTSEGEKNSHSEADEPKEAAKSKGQGDSEKQTAAASGGKTSPTDVRKRKSRKAD